MTEMTDHTDHTAHTDHPEHPEVPQRTKEIPPAPATVEPTTIIFNGLLVFQHDLANKVCNVGVLRARDSTPPHILQIEVDPNPNTGTGTLKLDPELLESYVQAGNIRWMLDVVKSGQPVPAGIVVNPAIPADRRTITEANKEDFGWIINMESGEFHSGPLIRTRGQLKPIIKLSTGLLFTSCMANPVDVKQGPITRSPFGFIAGAIGLRLKPTDGDIAVLYFKDQQGVPTEIFRLPNINQISYTIKIQNTPREGPAGGHFHMFYDRLFRGVGTNQKFDIVQHYPLIPVPAPAQRCPEGISPVPDPFKCGGVSVGSGSGPLE